MWSIEDDQYQDQREGILNILTQKKKVQGNNILYFASPNDREIAGCFLIGLDPIMEK